MIDVCIPHLASRGDMLRRAVASVCAQTLPANAIHIATDLNREGAARTRNRALAMSNAEYVAFLDDDDEFMSHHLELLHETAEATGADLVYPWFECPNGWDPFRVDGVSPEGRPFDDRMRDAILTECNFIPVTVLVRREFVMDLGGFPEPESARWPAKDCEDWGMWRNMLDEGAKFVHRPVRSWWWWWHGRNTSGMADR